MTGAKAHVLLVGATSGLGLDTATHPKFRHYTISMLGRTAPKQIVTSDAVTFYSCDLTKTARVGKLLKKICLTRGVFDACVFFQRYRGELDAWEGEVAVTLSATKTIIESISDGLIAKRCALVAVSSVNAHLINPDLTAGYHVCKAGLSHLMRYCAVALGPRGVTANSIAAGTFVKSSSRDFWEKNKRLRALYKKYVPLRRLPTSDDIVNMIQFLISEEGAFVTGQDIVMDGGLSLLLQDSLIRKLGNL